MGWIYWQCFKCKRDYEVSEALDAELIRNHILYPVCRRCQGKKYPKLTENLRTVLTRNLRRLKS